MRYFLKALWIFSCFSLLEAQSIEEKKAYARDNLLDERRFESLEKLDQTLKEKRFALKELYQQAQSLKKPEKLLEKVQEIQALREEIIQEQELWQEEYSQGQAYSLWRQEQTNIGELFIDHGPNDAIYLIPEEVYTMEMHLHSNLAIPGQAKQELLTKLLEANGIAIRTLHPFLKELYLLEEQQAKISSIISDRLELLKKPLDERVAYLLESPGQKTEDLRAFFERFVKNDQSSFELLSGKIFIFSSVQTILEFLKLYDFLQVHQKSLAYKVFSFSKSSAEELKAIFEAEFSPDLDFYVFGDSLLVKGSSQHLERACALFEELEQDLSQRKKKTVFHYQCRHSSAQDLAKTLSGVYALLDQEQETEREAFVTDAKTGSILMIIEQEKIAEMKALLKKLDVPKKMVRIEALLVEKKSKDSNQLGLSSLKMGSEASNLHQEGLSWQEGILSFLLQRQKTNRGLPAYDMAYQFLLSHEELQINASPSVTTVNQTPASIEILEEISINTGTVLERDDHKNSVLKDSYNRADYGIVIDITPTIHERDEEEDIDYITLSTDIRFDSTNRNQERNRPDVIKRHIKNEVRIADGQTVIIGGLRIKDLADMQKSIPFLGDLPGLGKLFGNSSGNDHKTEMFIFLTPKIIADPALDFEKIRIEELKKRPGDLPEFFQALEESRRVEKKRVINRSLKAVFGLEEKPNYYEREFDGR